MTYELVYIIDPALTDEVRKELIERFNGLIAQAGGTVDKVDEWGKRRLAYPINDLNEGYYVLTHFTAPTDLPRELERNMQIQDSVMRYLITRVEVKRSNVKPRQQAANAYQAEAPSDAPAAE